MCPVGSVFTIFTINSYHHCHHKTKLFILGQVQKPLSTAPPSTLTSSSVSVHQPQWCFNKIVMSHSCLKPFNGSLLLFKYSQILPVADKAPHYLALSSLLSFSFLAFSFFPTHPRTITHALQPSRMQSIPQTPTPFSPGWLLHVLGGKAQGVEMLAPTPTSSGFLLFNLLLFLSNSLILIRSYLIISLISLSYTRLYTPWIRVRTEAICELLFFTP